MSAADFADLYSRGLLDGMGSRELLALMAGDES